MIINFSEIQRLTSLDKKTIEQRALKLTEETGEVAQAILSSKNISACGYKNKTKEDVIEECLDVIIVASSIISQSYSNNVDEEFVNCLYSKKLNKWKEKI